MKQANVSELKARLRAYLGYVRETGESVEIYDRKTRIASLVPVDRDEDALVIDEPAATGKARRIRPVRPRRSVDLDALLDDLRGTR